MLKAGHTSISESPNDTAGVGISERETASAGVLESNTRSLGVLDNVLMKITTKITKTNAAGVR